MGVYRVLTCLNCSRPGGKNIAAEDFLSSLSFAAEGAIASKYSSLGTWRTSGVEFFPVLLSDFAAEEVPTEAFFNSVQAHLRGIAAFLDRQSSSIFEEFREQGLKPYLYLEVRMTQDQMELNLPPEFLSACARLGLGLELISNDISAAEAEDAGWV